MMTYGTGAIMAVPAHDERDFEFAQQVRPAHPGGHRARPIGTAEPLAEAYTGQGAMVNSGPFDRHAGRRWRCAK